MDDEFPVRKHDVTASNGMFIIGKRNIFKSKRLRKYKSHVVENSSPEYTRTINKKIKKTVLDLECFETGNRYNILTEVSDDNIPDIVKKIGILKVRKKDLKKCKTCNFKRRQCVIDPQSCKAIGLHCFICKKNGHFSKSLCCKSRRKLKGNKNRNESKKIDQVIISKRNLKLINMKINQIEYDLKRKELIKLAGKCAKKFECNASSKS